MGDEEVALYVAYLKHVKKLAHSTIKCHLSGIAFLFKMNYGRDSTKSFKITMLLKSYGKSDTVLFARRPIDKKLLQKLLNNLYCIDLSTYDINMYSLMYYFMYRCALRVSEVCSTRSSEHMILFRNVAYCRESNTITIRLLSYKHSNKVSPLLKLPCNKKLKMIFCNYVKHRCNANEAFFLNCDGSLVKRSQLVHIMKHQLASLAYDPALYNTHSFRIGRATDLATKGYSEAQIAIRGRWKSNAYKKYIKPTFINC